MSDQNFVLSDQDGVLVGHMSFQEKKIICSPVIIVSDSTLLFQILLKVTVEAINMHVLKQTGNILRKSTCKPQG